MCIYQVNKWLINAIVHHFLTVGLHINSVTKRLMDAVELINNSRNIYSVNEWLINAV